MYFKLELQPVNHGDYALPCCELSGSEEFPLLCRSAAVRGLRLGIASVGAGKGSTSPTAGPGWKTHSQSISIPAGHRLQPWKGPSPMSFPSWVVSSLLAGAASCPHPCANTPEITLKTRVQNIPGGRFAPKTCAVLLWEHQPLGLSVLSDRIFTIMVLNNPNFIIVVTSRFSFLCSQTTNLN